MFHHFHDNQDHLEGQGSISSHVFIKVINYLLSNYRIHQPDEFIDKVITNTLSSGDIVLTFDDALKSQVDIAFPILDRYNIKSFFFIYNEAFYDQPNPIEFYRDFRNNSFKNVDEYYQQFFLKMSKEYSHKFKIYLNEFSQEYLSQHTFYSINDRKYRFVRDQVLTKEEYDYLLAQMLSDSGYSVNERKSKLYMSLPDLKTLSQTGHYIGLHSTTHPYNFDQLPANKQLNEYKSNLDFVKKYSNSEGLVMSHPFGKYSNETLEILKSLGVNIGFKSTMNPNKILTPLEIPREDHINFIKRLNL